MPSFASRLGRHANRSQHAIVDPQQASTSGSAGRTGANVNATTATELERQQQHQRQASQQHQHQQQHPSLLDEADLAAHSASSSVNAQQSMATPHPAMSTHNTAYSSNESFDSRQPPPPHHLQQQPPPLQSLQQQQGGQQTLHRHPPLPLQQQQQQSHPQSQSQSQPPPISPSRSTASGAPPPPHLYSSPSATSSTNAAINNPPAFQQNPNQTIHGVGPSAGFDGNQSHHDFPDRADLGRSQSIRYSTHISQQQPGLQYGIATSSVDDLNNSINYGSGHAPSASQPQQVQEKRASTRSRLIKGLFGSGHKGSQPDQQQKSHGVSLHGSQPSFDNNSNSNSNNTSGLGRRQSTIKRVSKLSKAAPSIQTSFSEEDGYSPSNPPQPPSLTYPPPHTESHSSSPSQSFSATNSQPQSATGALLTQAQVQTPFQAQTAQTQPQPQNPDLDWHQPPVEARSRADAQPAPYSSHSFLFKAHNDLEEYYSTHESNSQIPSQNSRIPNTIRQVSDLDPYDEVVYQQHDAPHQQQQQQQQLQQDQQHPQPPPPPQQQPHVQLHTQDQQQSQPHFETGAYDQQHSPQSLTQQGYSFPSPQHQGQLPTSAPQGGDSRFTQTHLGPSSRQPNPETVSQFSHESPITDSDQRSANLHSEQDSPALKPAVYVHDQGSTPSLPPVQQITTQPQQQPGMAPPPTGGPPPSRRNPDADQAIRGQIDVPGGPPSYRHSTAPMNTMNPLPPVPGQVQGQPPPQGQGQPPGAPPVYRGERSSQFEGPKGAEQGRDSPQPAAAVPSESSEGDKAFKDLLTKYKNVKRLYFDGKSQIEALNSQVEQLQNAVANQRMSQSRTALDDSEYSTRFNRLNGAINNLSFNIRKDWTCVPQWLQQYVSPDALKTGKQEMTAIGRAVISRWIAEEIFNKCFHPGLDPQLSQDLKEIELSIRHNAYTMSSQEEFNALTSKVVSWRMTTLEGLNRQLNSADAVDNRALFTDKCTINLTACLYQFLSTPPPPGVEGSTSMIVELAVGIAANLPLESRDVAITYPLPGDILQPHLMELEKGALPPLEPHREEDDDEDSDENEKDKNGQGRTDKPKTGTLKTATKPGAVGRESSEISTSGMTDTDVEGIPALAKNPSRVRFAGFLALEVRGRQVLMKAPVWTI
ncbi:hypothetical protein BGZ63DRAFT_405952 [Mariannaea sp. PMI_226]|nr:hypothetical protein BGZ63DRAFT_405952 [Mariannaea sp. PMI_226]